ncbi:hypothetical protein M5D96_010944 [Drosophila gunungcola]|uniref:Uncharacterized protein n=1 Tax=Drosophila gunungcola TaxID=103775 RepID=A0A9Q0BLK2_9MUSC|nr:hypothetical protein M5D96_010944 [Drosophila gunungcola]
MLTLSAGIVIGVCLILQQQKTEAAHFLNPICGVSYESFLGTRITNGKEAVLRSAPFMAYLTHNNKFHGGGSIISSSS